MQLTKKDIQKEIKKLALEQPWHHNIKLPYSIMTIPNRQETLATNIGKWKRIEPIINRINLSGVRVLDVGCSDGYYSFEISKKGVSEVISIDLNELRLKKAAFVKEVLNITNVELKQFGIEQIDEKTIGHFDVVLCLGFLHRFPDPYGLLTKLATIADIIILEWKMPRINNYGLPVMTFATSNIYGIDKYNVSFFYPTFQCVMAILKRAGFENHYPIDDGINKRVAMVSTRSKIMNLDNHYSIHLKSRLYLIKKYTMMYFKTVCKIMLGRIRV